MNYLQGSINRTRNNIVKLVLNSKQIIKLEPYLIVLERAGVRIGTKGRKGKGIRERKSED